MFKNYIMKCCVAGLCVAGATSSALAGEWRFGIGTGFYGLNIDGDGGFHTALGPVDFDVDLDTGDVSDYMDTALGFGGYATNGEYTILYSFGTYELEEKVSASRGGTQGTLKVEHDSTKAELLVDYTFAKGNKHMFGVLGGVRYGKKEFNADLTIDGVQEFSGTVDENWTDAVIGLTHKYRISKSTLWSSRVDVGFGGSEGSFFFDTGVSWKFSKSFSARFYGSIMGHDFEEDNRGDADWFKFDVNEFGVGVGILYNW